MEIQQVTIEYLKKIARIEPEPYESAVTCGNYDDAYNAGDDNGSVQVARHVLNDLGITW